MSHGGIGIRHDLFVLYATDALKFGLAFVIGGSDWNVTFLASDTSESDHIFLGSELNVI